MRLFIMMIISLSLFGRDNPFFPVEANVNQPTTTNQVETLTPFTQQNITLPSSARAIRAITIEYQNMDGSIHEQRLPLNSSIDWHNPLTVTQGKTAYKPSGRKEKPAAGTAFIRFKPESKTLHIMTQDKLLRHFMLTGPHRIVMDFQRETSFKPKEFLLDQAPYKKIRMGNHDHFYRVVIELDGQYDYTIISDEKAMQIVCQ